MDIMENLDKNSFKMMVVDDEAPIREMILQGIHRAGFINLSIHFHRVNSSANI